MLVLTRRPGESIIIAGDIKITVVNVGPGRVKIGIEAPPHVRVDRQEIHEKIEHSADVLAAVGESIANANCNTMVGSGGDTAAMTPALAPAADSGVTPAHVVTATPVAAAPGAGKLDKYRFPRKPR